MADAAPVEGPAPTPSPNPLAVSWPSPMMLVHYPLFATNVKILCQRDAWRSRGQSSFATTIHALRLTYQIEGVIGLYRGAHIYLLHQATRDFLRFLADHGLGFFERRLPHRSGEAAAEGEDAVCVAKRSSRRLRTVTKYLIDAMCYPILLASTRGIILRYDPRNTWEHMCYWRREEGLLSLFHGLTASLLSTAFDEAMDMLLAFCIDRCAVGIEIDMADRLLLKASGSSVVSIFTAPINYVGVIQRCQSRLPGLLEPSPIWGTVVSLPWRGSLYQLIMFGGILALNVRLIQWKLELQALDDPE
mmetsp:Transcript_41640/g.90794  ORF Transcript_41640/g.90794 Transcript_41640/m.90794 type:complete len:303 (-) Transcript_41640:53-961(-)